VDILEMLGGDLLLRHVGVRAACGRLELVLSNLAADVLAVEQRGDLLEREWTVRALRLDDREV
jgi:hypothetical protein